MTKRFLITCATGDIGKATCEYLAKKNAKKIAAGKDGYELVITARDMKKLEGLATYLTSTYKIPTQYFCADFAKEESFDKLLHYFMKVSVEKDNATIKVENPLHGVVLLPPRPIAESYFEPTSSEMEAMHKICINAPYRLLKKLIPALQTSDSQSPSHVVYPGGLSSLQPLGDNLLFNTWRTGMVSILKTLSDKYGRHNIVFNTLSFGQVLTDKFLAKLNLEAAKENTTAEAILAKKTANVPTGKYTSLISAAKGISFFLKSKGSANITGENISITGGFIRRY